MQVQSNNIPVRQIGDTSTNQPDLQHSTSNTSGQLPVQPTPVLDSPNGVLVSQVNSALKQIQVKQIKRGRHQ